MSNRPLVALALMLVALPLSSMPATAGDAPPATLPTDQLVVFMPPRAQVLLLSPSMDAMRLEYHPPAGYVDPVVALARFGGEKAVRYWDRSWNDPVRPDPSWLTVLPTAPFAGQRADGTWTIVEAMDPQQQHPGGAQLTVRGKVFDDVMPDVAATSLGAAMLSQGVPGTGSEPIEGNGGGRFAADLSSNVKSWNWDEQVEAWYDVGPVSAQNSLNPEQDPQRWTFFKGPVPYAPSVYASGPDGLWAHLAPFSSVRLTSPMGQSMSVLYDPLADGAACSALAEGTNCAEPAIVHVLLDGTVVSARQAYHSSTPVPLRRFVVQGNLDGQPADGTWSVEGGRNKFGLPAGVRLAIGGKTFDNVDSSPGIAEIESTGTGDVAGGLVEYRRSWNWHVQAAPWHHAFVGSEMTNVEYPGMARYLGASANLGSSVAPVDPGSAPHVSEKAKTYTDGHGNAYVFVDDDGDSQPDPNELQVHVPPVGTSVTGTLPTPGTLGAGGWSRDWTAPYAYRFDVTYTGLVPPDDVVLVIDGAYYTATDAVVYPRGYTGRSHHVMVTQDPVTFDGSRFTVTVQLQPGAHTYRFEASDPLLRWTATPEATGPTV